MFYKHSIHILKKVKTPIKLNDKVIGYIQEDTFYKPVFASKHQLKFPPAWSIDAQVFDEQIKPITATFVVQDKETDTEYHVSISTFDHLKRELDRGHGRQYFLTLGHWEVHGNGHEQLSLSGGGE